MQGKRINKIEIVAEKIEPHRRTGRQAAKAQKAQMQGGVYVSGLWPISCGDSVRCDSGVLLLLVEGM